MIPNFQKIIDETTLLTGKHESFEKGACAMELLSYIANEPWSDRPQCACPALTSYAINVNDRSDDIERQKLKAFIPRLVNTRDGMEKERANFLVHANITRTLPLLTDALGLAEISEKLRSFKMGQWIEMRDYTLLQSRAIREAMRKIAAYADAAAYASAAYAAAYAADAAAYAAAYAADASAAADDPAIASKWKAIRQSILDMRLQFLSEAIELGKTKRSDGPC